MTEQLTLSHPFLCLKKQRIHIFHKFIMKYLQINKMMFEIYSKIIQDGEGKEMGRRGS